MGIGLGVLFLSLFLSFPIYGNSNRCNELVDNINKNLRDVLIPKEALTAERYVPPKEIKTLDVLLESFSRGFEPDFKDPSQVSAFELYLKMKFGHDTGYIKSDSVEKIKMVLRQYPELAKKRAFREYSFEIQGSEKYPVTEGLRAFADREAKHANEAIDNLFGINNTFFTRDKTDVKLEYWGKLLNYRDNEFKKEIQRIEEEYKETDEESVKKKIAAQNAAKSRMYGRFFEVLNLAVSQKERLFISNKGNSAKVRAKKLFQALYRHRAVMEKEGKDTTVISQALVNIVYTIGFHNKAFADGIKGSDGQQVLNNVKDIQKDSDVFAGELGYADRGHLSGIMKEVGVKHLANGLDVNGLDTEISKLQTDLSSKVQRDASSSGYRKRVRATSAAEAPYRSRTGKHCESGAEFEKAFDPNYQFFTVTNESGFSDGNITIVLGKAEHNGSKTKIALMFTVNNVLSGELAYKVECIRRSLLEEGYILARISNETMDRTLTDRYGHQYIEYDVSNTGRNDIKEHVKIDNSVELTNFEPHKTQYDFPPNENYYWIAKKPKLYPVKALEFSPNAKIIASGKTEGWARAQKLDLNVLAQESYKLKEGSVEDKIRYISTMETLRKAELAVDPAFESTLEAWLRDKTQEYKLREQVVLHELEKERSLPSLLDHFEEKQQAQLVKEIFDKPKYKDIVLENKSQLPALAVKIRDSKGVSKIVLKEYDKRYVELMSEVLQAKDIPNAQAESLISGLKESFAGMSIYGFVRVSRLLRGTSIEASFERKLVEQFLANNWGGNANIYRELHRIFTSVNLEARAFAKKLLAMKSDPEMQKYLGDSRILEIVTEIGDLASKERIIFLEAITEWLSKSEVSADKKAEFLVVNFGTKEFEVLDKHLPKAQRESVWHEINRTSSITAYMTLAKQRGLSYTEAFEGVRVEAFQYRDAHIPDRGVTFKMGDADAGTQTVTLTKNFEAQATVFTQLQLYLLTGEAPSRFSEEGKMIKGKKVDLNRPVEQVSHDEIQVAFKQLNKVDPMYNHRLPTEAEWEYMARANTTTKYYYGNSEDYLGEYGWYSSNSNSKTQKVAGLKPNGMGLYDMSGNVLEWTGDWYGYYSQTSLTDPTGPTEGSSRVVRGGSWGLSAVYAGRSYGRPGGRYDLIGARPVRTPK